MIVDDVRRVFERGRLRLSADAVDFLYRSANTPGLGGCRDLVQTIADLYPGETITAELLRAALDLRLGTEHGIDLEQRDAKRRVLTA